MSVVVKSGSNIASLSAQRRLAENSALLSRTFERLSSGLRINRASDDAAGLAVASALSSDRRVFIQGVRNLNDGISLLNIADSAVQTLSSIVTRLQELAGQAANGSISNLQRKAIDAEKEGLSGEFTRIARETGFNGRKLFNGTMTELSLQGGYGADGGITSGLGGAIGNGLFSTIVTPEQVGNGVSAAKSGDINNDGIPDLVTFSDPGAGLISVFLGQGGGSFSKFATYSLHSDTTQDGRLTDINGDGILDILTVGRDGTNGVFNVLLGNGDGSFTPFASYSTPNSLKSSLDIGDLNGDGIPDVITSDTWNPDNISVYLGTGTGLFTPVSGSFAPPGSFNPFEISHVSLGDLNNDGFLDVVASGSEWGTDGQTIVYLGDGAGSYSQVITLSMSIGEAHLSHTLADLNNDGNLDMFVTTSGKFSAISSVYLGLGNGNFGSSVQTLAFSVSLTDLNGDGVLDLVGSGLNSASHLGNGDGTFTLRQTMDTMGNITFADVSGDGVLDFLSIGLFGEIQVSIANTVAGINPLLDIDLSTLAGARQALPILENKFNVLTQHRATIGSFQSRVSFAASELYTRAENYSAAESRIREADIAGEAANLARLNILQQTSTALLAQVNQQPALVLRLLRSDEDP